jgi:hypothetical protein
MMGECQKILSQLEGVESKVEAATSSEDVAKVLSEEIAVTTNAELELKWLKEQIKRSMPKSACDGRGKR